MARIHGKGGAVKIDTDGGGSTEALCAITNWSIDYKGGADETTGLDSAGVKAFLAGLTEWSGSFNAQWDSDETDTLSTAGELPLLGVGARVELELWMDGSIYYGGDAIITGFKPEVGVDAIIKLSADFQGTEALT